MGACQKKSQKNCKLTCEKDLKAGGFKAHRHIASILKLMEHYENTEPDKPDYSTMSDEELLEIMSQSVLD